MTTLMEGRKGVWMSCLLVLSGGWMNLKMRSKKRREEESWLRKEVVCTKSWGSSEVGTKQKTRWITEESERGGRVRCYNDGNSVCSIILEIENVEEKEEKLNVVDHIVREGETKLEVKSCWNKWSWRDVCEQFESKRWFRFIFLLFYSFLIPKHIKVWREWYILQWQWWQWWRWSWMIGSNRTKE